VSLLLLGSWNPRWLSGFVVLFGPPIKLYRSSQALWLCGVTYGHCGDLSKLCGFMVLLTDIVEIFLSFVAL
jgi:hypothetical protein